MMLFSAKVGAGKVENAIYASAKNTGANRGYETWRVPEANYGTFVCANKIRVNKRSDHERNWASMDMLVAEIHETA